MIDETLLLFKALKQGDNATALTALSMGASVYAEWDEDDSTPLHCAVAHPKITAETVQALIDKGADVCARDFWDASAWHTFCQSVTRWDARTLSVAYVLLKERVPVDAEDDEGLTGLDYVTDERAHTELSALVADAKRGNLNPERIIVSGLSFPKRQRGGRQNGGD